MKKFLFSLLSIIVAFSALSANVEKEYKKFISKYDVADEAKNVKQYSPAQFWMASLDNYEALYKFTKDIHKSKGAEKEALQKTANLPRFYPQYDRTVIEEMQGFCDTLLMDMGIKNLSIKCSLHIVYADELNAFCALKEEGFAICLSSALLSQRGMNYNILMGYVAHEFAHGALMHHLRGFYAEAKERRKNELWGGIAAGLNGLAAGMEAYNAAAYGIPPSGTDYGAVIANIGNDIKMSTLKYSFKYSREQEVEADLFAFRFLENLGCGEEFIKGLRILGTEYDALYSEYSDHPTISSRIGFLQFVQQNPTLGNKENAKMKKKRNAPEAE